MSLRTPRWIPTAAACSLIAAGWLLAQALPRVQADPPPASLASGIDKNVVATVNGVPITRQELAEELIARKGRQQLELLINRRIIEQAAQKAGVSVTDAEIEADLKDFMQTAGCTSARDFENRVLKQRQTTLLEYKEDVIRPAILMRKLGGQRVAVHDEDLKKAFDAKYGEKVQCRIILNKDVKVMRAIYEELIKAAASGEKNAQLNTFLRHAKTQADPTLASTGGMINPIGRYGSYDLLEKRAFEMADNELSEVIQTPEGYVILLREKLLPAVKNHNFDEEKESLRKEIAEKKLRVEVPKLFKEIREKAVVQDYLNNKIDIKQIMEQMSRTTPSTPTKSN